MADYQGKKVVIIGLGMTGLSCVDFFMARGVTPRVMDTRVAPPGLDKLPESVECHVGGLNDTWLLAADLIVASPGIALAHPSLSAAADAGVEIVGDIELFCREAQAPIIAITGSNGKSTVTTLVGEMAKAAGVNVGVGGNIGLPALMLLDTDRELYVLELSSFQLETTSSLQAVAATILNVTEDHMDRYPLGLQQYRAAKLRIYENAKTCVVNADDALTMPVRGADERCISFGVDVGDYHLNRQQGETWLRVKGEKVLNVKEMPLTGQHNYSNALAALALADAAGLPRASSLKALTTFTGLAHRFQLVLDHNGVRWINDSKATNVGSTEAALNGLQLDGTLYLLLGGDGTRSEKALNGYLGDVYRLLKEHGLHEKAAVYGVVYDFGDFMNVGFARRRQMEKYGRNIRIDRELSPETTDPKYVGEIFDKFLLPRISTDRGRRRLSADEAALRVRRLNIVAHCHGAYTALRLEEMMQEKMKELGYTPAERRQVQKQLLIMAQSPYCPLGQSQSTFVSFASVLDDEVSHYNNFEAAIRKINARREIPPCYFPGRQGSLFLVGSMGKDMDQHNFWGFHPSPEMSREGQALATLAAKVLINGVMTASEPIPSIENLAADTAESRRLFRVMETNGREIYRQITAESVALHCRKNEER